MAHEPGPDHEVKAQTTGTLLRPGMPDGIFFRSRQASPGFLSASRRSSLPSLPSKSKPHFLPTTQKKKKKIPMKRTVTATLQGSPAPPDPLSPKSGATKRPRKAAALSDVTNLLLPETPTPIKPRRTARRPLPQPSDASSTCSSSASVTPAPKRSSSAAVLEEECGVVKSPAISTVYARRGTTEGRGRRREAPATNKGKGKEPAAAAASGTASCPQLGKSTGNSNRKTSMAEDTRSISSSAPCHEAKKKRPLSSTSKLPEDFVKKQRAYFADIDAFELPEEEVSETDLN